MNAAVLDGRFDGRIVNATDSFSRSERRIRENRKWRREIVRRQSLFLRKRIP